MYLNVDSPLSVASQCRLVLRAIETEIIATLYAPMWLWEDFIFRIIINIEHQNRHKSILLHCVLLDRHISRLLQCKFELVMVTQLALMLALNNFHVLGLGLEKSLGLGLGLENFLCPWPWP